MERKSLEEAFKKIYDIGDIEVLQSAEFQEYFADIAPDLQKYRGIVKSFVNIEGNKNLVKIISSNTEKQKIEVLKIVQELEDKYLYKKENCTDICIAFCRTIGINIDIYEKEKSIGKHINTTKEKNDIKISTTTQKNVQNNNEIEKYRVGDIISWGNYPNTSDGSKRPIKWKILEIKEDNALLLCDNILDAKAYHNKRKKVTWKTSDIRKWLNEDFYDTAFDFKEKIYIRNMFIEVKNNLIYSIRRNDIEDKIFLLSKEEVEKFFLKERDRKVQATNYALNRGVCPVEDEDYYFRMEYSKIVRYPKKYSTSYCWWLRSVEKCEFRADIVYGDGTISRTGVYRNDIGIRPALWIDLAAFNMVSQW